MKKFIKKIVVVLTMTSAMIANVNAATRPQVQAKVNQAINNLAQPRNAYSTIQRDQDVAQLRQYSQEYPEISNELNTIISALNLGSGDARRMQSQPKGNAYKAQQNINAIFESASISQPMTSPRRPSVVQAVTPALVNQQSKEVDKAVADLRLSQKQAADQAEQAQKKIIAAKTETAKENAQINADKAVEMANAKVAEKKQIAIEKLKKLQNSVAQSNQPAIIEDAQKIVDLKEQKDLATNAADKQKIAGEITMLDAQMKQEEQEQGTTGWKASILKAVSTYKNSLIALGVGVAGTAAGYMAYQAGYTPEYLYSSIPSRESMTNAARSAYNRLPSTESMTNTAQSLMSYAPSGSTVGYAAAGTTALGATAYGVNKYRTMEKEVTPADLSKAATDLKAVGTKLENAQVAANKLPSDANLNKVEALKIELDAKTAKTVNALENLRSWTGDLKGYSQQERDLAVNVLMGKLYPREKQLKEMLSEIKNDKTYTANTTKAEQTAAYNDVNKSLKQVQNQIHDQEVIAGLKYSNALKRSFYALTGAAVLGAAAATDYYFNEGNLMKSAAGYGSAALATGASYARSGWNTASGYGRSFADKASNYLPDSNTFSKYAPDSNTPGRLFNSAAARAQAAKKATQKLWYGTPDTVKNIGAAGATSYAGSKVASGLRSTENYLNPNINNTLDPAMTDVYGSDNSYLGQLENPVTSAVKNSAARAALTARQSQVAPTTRQFQGANLVQDARTGKFRAPTMAEARAMRNAQ